MILINITMKTLKLYILLLVVAAGCVLAACSKEKPQQLPAPSNLHIENDALIWDAVENATGYIVYFNDAEYKINKNRFNVSFITEEGSYEINVSATGDGKRFCNSETTKYTYTIDIDEPEPPAIPTPNLKYTLLEDESGYEVSKGTADLTGKIIIPDYYRGLPVKKIAEYAFSYHALGGIILNTKTTGVRLPETLEVIGRDAFMGCSKLTEIYIPETVKTIEFHSFYYSALKKITFPSQLTTIEAGVFQHCNDLKEIILPSKLKQLGASAFYNCESLEKISIPDGITQIEGYLFYGCTSLSEIQWPEKIESFGDNVVYGTAWLAAQPDGLVVVNDKFVCGYNGFPNGGMVNVPYNIQHIAGGAFKGTKLVYITIPEHVTLGTCVFAECDTLETVILPGDLKDITSRSFYNCTALKNVTLPEGLTTIHNTAFNGCSALTSIDLPLSLEIISGFYMCGLKSIVIPEGYTEIAEQAFYCCANLIEVKLPSTMKKIGNYSFSRCDSLKDIEIPEGVIIDKNAFKNCSNLTNIKLSDGVKIYETAFSECSSLKNIVIPDGALVGKKCFEDCAALETASILGGNVTEYTFLNCGSLKSVELHEGIKEIKERAFEDCINLTTVQLPSSLEIINDNAFDSCKSITEIAIPGGVTLGKSVFCYCESLKTVTLAAGITKLPQELFYHCINLTDVVLPEGLLEIEDIAFMWCSSLTEIKLPSTLTTIGSGCFSLCENLKKMVLPVSLASSVNKIFDCKKLQLESIYFAGTESEWKNNIPDGFTLSEGTTVYFYIENASDVPADGKNYWHYLNGKITLWG